MFGTAGNLEIAPYSYSEDVVVYCVCREIAEARSFLDGGAYWRRSMSLLMFLSFSDVRNGTRAHKDASGR